MLSLPLLSLRLVHPLPLSLHFLQPPLVARFLLPTLPCSLAHVPRLHAPKTTQTRVSPLLLPLLYPVPPARRLLPPPPVCLCALLTSMQST